jgi:peptide deformylase
MTDLIPLLPNDIILRNVCRPIGLKELHTKKIQNIVENLLDFVYQTSNKGTARDKNRPSTVGLSANQLGYNLSIAIVDLGIGHKSYNDLHVLVNPEITWSSKTIIERDEGCVNLEHIRGFVKRSKRIKVSAFDRSGNKITLDVHGWPAILLQHEINHLNGKLFIDKLPNPKKAHHVLSGELRNYKKLKQSWTKYIDVSNLVK